MASGSSGRDPEAAGVFGTGQDVVEEALLLLLLEEDPHPLDRSEDADEDSPDERVGVGVAEAGSFGGFRNFFGLVRELNGIGVEIELLLPLQHPLDELALLLPLLQGVESCWAAIAASFALSSLMQDSSSALALRLVLSWLSSSKRWSGFSSAIETSFVRETSASGIQSSEMTSRGCHLTNTSTVPSPVTRRPAA